MKAVKQHFDKQSTRKLFILLFSLVTFGFAWLMPDRHEMLNNYWYLLTHQTYLMHDLFEVVGLSATFFNIALHFLTAYYLMSRNERSNVNGLQMAAIGIFVGHGFFGTHIGNIIPIILGVVLYAKWTHQSFKLYTTVSLFATATAPIVSYVMVTPAPTIQSAILGIGAGLLIGFIAPPLAEQFLKFHHGFTLYNFGFTTGIIAMFFILLFPYFNWTIEPQSFLSNQYHHYLLVYYLLLLLLLAGFALWHMRDAWAKYATLIKSSGRVPDDFVSKFGLNSALLNMALNGLMFFVLLLLLNVTFTGPILGGLCSIIGFSAFGKHPRNCLPIAVGVILAASLLQVPLTDQRVVLAILFGTALSPIAGFYGLGYGVVAGFLHYNLTAVVFPLHQGMTLYNNGFTTGFVAAFLVPIIDTIQDHKHYWTKK
ncbi:DUF1576 domain-containing protein [Aerococcaceae bacterium NML180378]|nr:DUF1576 domain-containing protein [Aerococcaceae bacterium NML180378]